MCDAMVVPVGQDGSVEGRRATTQRLRRIQGGVLIAFLGFQQQAMNPGSLRGWPRAVAAVLAGGCFLTLLSIGWTLLMRCGDERRRALMQRSVMIGVAITMGAVCMAGYWEIATGARFHLPLLAIPACLVITTAGAKVVVFRHRRWPGLGTAGR